MRAKKRAQKLQWKKSKKSYKQRLKQLIKNRKKTLLRISFPKVRAKFQPSPMSFGGVLEPGKKKKNQKILF
jgi:hypothetical protein